jgi:choline kinase
LITQALLNAKGIELEVNIISGCAVLPVARNTLVAMFMQDPEATDLFFIDSDVGFDATAVLKLLKCPAKIVAGVYPLKQDNPGYPVQIKTIDGVPIGKEGLVEADYLPTGFMRIKREVIEAMYKAYPELKHRNSFVKTVNAEVDEMYDLFNMGLSDDEEWRTEDYAFCHRWTKIGGQLWVYPDIDFTHTGNKAFKGNYLGYLSGRDRAIKALKDVANQ